MDGTAVRTRSLVDSPCRPERRRHRRRQGRPAARVTAAKSVKVDLADPVLTCPAPPTYVYGSAAAAALGSPDRQRVGRRRRTTCPSRRTPDVAAGRHTVVYTANDNAGRSSSSTCGYDVTKAPLTVSAPSLDKVYGAAVPVLAPTVTGLVAGDTAADVLAGASLHHPATTTSGTGTYAVLCSGATSDRYDIAWTKGTLTVTPAPLTVVGPAAHRAYGKADPAFTPTLIGLVAGDDGPGHRGDLHHRRHEHQPRRHLRRRSAPARRTRTTRSSTRPAACWSRRPPSSSPPRPPSAPTARRTRRWSRPSTAWPRTTALRSSASAAPPTADAGSDAATYPVTCTAEASTDYEIGFVEGSLTVTPAALTVTASDETAVYGQAIPTPTASYAGLVDGDTVAATCTTDAVRGDHVDAYATSCEGVDDGNYTVTYVAGKLAITPAVATVTAPDATRTYGAANPTLVPAVSGLVDGDTAADLGDIDCSTVTTDKTPVGTSDTDCTGGQSDDYTVTHVRGSLTITPAELTVAAPTASRTYGSTPVDLVPDYRGLVAGDTVAASTRRPSAPARPAPPARSPSTRSPARASRATTTRSPTSPAP